MVTNTDGCFINYPDIELSDQEGNPDWPWHELCYKNKLRAAADGQETFRAARCVPARPVCAPLTRAAAGHRCGLAPGRRGIRPGANAVRLSEGESEANPGGPVVTGPCKACREKP